jgi:hypothetical protein
MDPGLLMGSPAEWQSAGKARPAAEAVLAPAETLPAGARNGGEPEVDFDVTVVDGEAGRRLAILQAEVILDVLTWLHQHQLSGRSAS